MLSSGQLTSTKITEFGGRGIRRGRRFAKQTCAILKDLVKGFQGRNEHANGWPTQVRPFAGAQQHLYKAFLFKAFEGWPKQMMAKAIGLNTGAYGYNPFGGGMSSEPAISAGHPETNLCYGLLETWLRSCSRPSMMLQTSVRVGRSSSAAAPGHSSAGLGKACRRGTPRCRRRRQRQRRTTKARPPWRQSPFS